MSHCPLSDTVSLQAKVYSLLSSRLEMLRSWGDKREEELKNSDTDLPGVAPD